MWPSSVATPVATTTPTPLPRVRDVPLNSIEWRSPRRASAATGAVDFSTATNSPVSVDSSAPRWDASTRRRSAETESPPSTSTMSPGTSASAGIRRVWLSRRTRTDLVPSARSASIERAALISVTKPISALIASTTTMAPPSSISPK